jgi:superfamily I DNA/RNA helicase
VAGGLAAGRPRRPAPRLVPDPGYWRQEINHVIKARGLREFPDYTGIDRLGRKVPLQTQHKAAVWDLYVEYQRRLAAAALLDHNDVLAMAVAELERCPPEPGYASVMVDEVTDLNLLGLRLVRLLAGDGPDLLLLIGDGRQAVYPGGARLHDAGIDVTGRAIVLRDNYRNTGAVLQAAALLTPAVASADPDDHGDDTATVTRPGGRDARWFTGTNLRTHDRALLDDLHDTAARLGGHAGLAVLCDTLDHVEG